jgi:hypothetical protein
VTLLALALAAAFTAGYAACLYKPLARIDTWAWDQVYRRTSDLRDGHARRRPGWYAAQAVFAVELAAAFLMRPRDTVASIRETRATRRQQREARP